MKDQIKQLLIQTLQDLGISGVEPEVQIADDSRHGEYTTNIAMQIFGSDKQEAISKKFKNPMELALSVKERIAYHVLRVTHKEQGQKISKKDHPISPQSPLSPTLQAIERVEAVPPGFINFFLTEASLISQIHEVLNKKEGYGKRKAISEKQKIAQRRVYPERSPELAEGSRRVMVEFAHPNTHKAFHIGHLRNISTGESIVRLLESRGVEVIRANYQGDVGMHIAKALYALLRIPNPKSQISKVRDQDIHKKVEFLGQAYAAGNKAFEESDEVKKEVGEINKKIYAKDTKIFPLYQETRQWSLDYFAGIYQRVGSHFDRYYFEGEVYESGKQYVLEGLKNGIFAESEGAIIFPGEKYARLPDGQGLHNRVFITKEGNTTYEGKDVGLVRLQLDEYQPDLIIHVVGPEQAGYFEVLFKALEQLFPETKGKEYHLIYGWVRLKRGKMSSRAGNVITGEWLLDEAKQVIYDILEKNKSKDTILSRLSDPGPDPGDPESPQPSDGSRVAGRDDNDRNYTAEEMDDIAEKTAVAAVKYAFLRVSTKQEIAFDLKESVSFEGDSGPYLLYTYARCRSVLRKSNTELGIVNTEKKQTNHDSVFSIQYSGPFNPEERSVARLISFFPEIVAEAAITYAPNLVCNYLFQLAQAFNLFYQKHSILGGDKREATSKKQEGEKGLSLITFRLSLTGATAQVLHNGLYLLGIETVEKM